MKNAVVPYEKKLPVEYVYEFKLVTHLFINLTMTINNFHNHF